MNEILTRLLEPLQFPFMWEAVGVAVLVGTVGAVLSCFLVLKGWSLMGDAVSHAVLPGVVLAYLAGIPLAIGAFIAGLACSLGTGWIGANSRVKRDTVLGVVFTGLFALGLVLFSRVRTDVHLNHVLYGNLLGIERADLIQAVAISLVTLMLMLVYRKDLLLFSFDPSHARAVGLNTTFLHYLMLALVSATVVASLQAVGIILTVAMLIGPGCVAYLLTDRFGRMLWIAVATAAGSAAVGTYLSFFVDGATGACIVLTQAAVFTVAMVIAPKHGLIASRRRARAALAET